MNKIRFVLIVSLLGTRGLIAQDIVAQWDSIKAETTPVVSASIAAEYETPCKLLLADYGWEDGIHISRDGLHLYALYFPGDLFGWSMFFMNNLTNLPFCELVGNMAYKRDYAGSYEMDFETNMFGCDNFINVDILYSTRSSPDEDFVQWQLSGIARPGLVEGGSMPLFSESNDNEIEIFLFTGNSDIWMIKNTTANPTGIETAVRLAYPINPITDEFNADNPHLERLDEETLILVFERYTDFSDRYFVYSFSYDGGDTWTEPIAMSTITPELGHIEHPHLYKDTNGEWWFYYSIDCNIYRSKQIFTNDWDSWTDPELIIHKGNSPCIGEPSLTNNGDILFALAYQHNSSNDTTDVYDLDPWILKRKEQVAIVGKTTDTQVHVFPNPTKETLNVSAQNVIKKCEIFDANERLLFSQHYLEKEIKIHAGSFSDGFYFIKIHFDDTVIVKRFMFFN